LTKLFFLACSETLLVKIIELFSINLELNPIRVWGKSFIERSTESFCDFKIVKSNPQLVIGKNESLNLMAPQEPSTNLAYLESLMSPWLLVGVS